MDRISQLIAVLEIQRQLHGDLPVAFVDPSVGSGNVLRREEGVEVIYVSPDQQHAVAPEDVKDHEAAAQIWDTWTLALGVRVRR